MINYTAKVDSVVGLCCNFTKKDWIDLALACIDQADVSLELQQRVKHILPEFDEEDGQI